jgi:hypothetical protein
MSGFVKVSNTGALLAFGFDYTLLIGMEIRKYDLISRILAAMYLSNGRFGPSKTRSVNRKAAAIYSRLLRQAHPTSQSQ